MSFNNTQGIKVHGHGKQCGEGWSWGRTWWRGKGRGEMGDIWLSVNHKRLKQLFTIHPFIFIHQKLLSVYHIL